MHAAAEAKASNYAVYLADEDGSLRRVDSFATEGGAWECCASALGRTLYGGFRVGYKTIEVRSPRNRDNTVQAEIVGPAAWSGREGADSRARWFARFIAPLQTCPVCGGLGCPGKPDCKDRS